MMMSPLAIALSLEICDDEVVFFNQVIGVTCFYVEGYFVESPIGVVTSQECLFGCPTIKLVGFYFPACYLIDVIADVSGGQLCGCK